MKGGRSEEMNKERAFGGHGKINEGKIKCVKMENGSLLGETKDSEFKEAVTED